MTELIARYSGKKSKDVWTLVAAIDHEPAHTMLYIAACALQDHEQRFLQMLRNAQPPVPPADKT